MNFALGTVLILLIVFPGVAFRESFYSGKYSRKYLRKTIVDDLIWALVPSFFIHIVFITLSFAVFPKGPDFVQLGKLIANSENFDSVSGGFSYVQDNFLYFVFYNILALAFGFIGGLLSNKLVLFARLDRRFTLLRFSNQWEYLMTGKCLDFPSYEGSSDYVDYVFVDVLTKANEKSIIYVGRLEEYYLGEQGKLDSLVLSSPKRRLLEEDDNKAIETSEKYYSIPSDLFIIPFSDIVNINLRYFKDAQQETELKSARFLRYFGSILKLTVIGFLLIWGLKLYSKLVKKQSKKTQYTSTQ